MRPRRLGSVLALGALVACLAHSAPVRADAQTQAREHFDRALAHLKANELERALAELETAQRLHPHYAVLYNLGLVHAALDHPDRAVEHLERYLELGGDAVPPARRAEVTELVASHEKRLARVTFAVTPEGAAVEIDGRDIGLSPLQRPVLLKTGRHDLVVRRTGHRREQRTVEVAAGSRPTVTVELVPDAPAELELVTLEVECAVPDATLRVDGAGAGRTPLASLAVPAGRHELTFVRRGYAASRHLVVADPKAATTVRCALRPLVPLPADQAGRIAVSHRDPHTVRVDGARLGGDGRVPSGRHRVEISAVGYRVWAQEVTVPAGGTLRLRPDLEADADRLRAQQSQRTAAYALGVGGLLLLGTAGGVWLWNDSRHNDWRRRQDKLDDLWAEGPPHSDDTKKGQIENDELFESIRAFDNVTLGLGVAGTACLTGGIVLYLTGDDPVSASRPVAALGPRGSYAGYRWAW